MGEIAFLTKPAGADVRTKVKISAVIPTYNRAAWIGRAVDSILDQTLPPSEIIIVDDGSTDGTADLLRNRYGDRLTIVQQANAGVSMARRKGIEVASGDWIAFLDSDDVWLPAHLEALASAAGALDPSISVVFGDTIVVGDTGDEGTLYGREGFSVPGPVEVFRDATVTQFPYMFSLLQSSLVRRDELIATGAFLERLRSSEDFLVSFRLALRSGFAAVPAPVSRIYRTTDLAESSLDKGKSRDEDYYRARMIAFGEAATLAQDGPWRWAYRRAAGGLTRLRIERRVNAVPVALQQFRFGITLSALAWTVAAFAGSLFARRT